MITDVDQEAFFQAISNKDIETVKSLCNVHQEKLDLLLHITDHLGYSPIHIAAIHEDDNTAILSYLLDIRPALVNYRLESQHFICEPIHMAAYNNLENFQLLHQRGADLNSFGRYYDDEYYSGTALHIAASLGKQEIVSYTIENVDKSCLLQQDEWGDTPLHRAIFASEFKREMVALLVHKNPSVLYATKNSNETPALAVIIQYMKSGEARFIEILKLLISHGVSVNLQGNVDSALVTISSFDPSFFINTEERIQRQKTLIDIVLSYNADVTCQDKDGNCDLLKIVRYADDEILKYICNYSVNYN